MMFDANTGAVLHNDDGDELRHPASLTKMMTLYLTFETIESGRLSMSDRVVISDEAAAVAPSKLGLEPGEDIAVADAIKALITKSANDVAVGLAEKIGGTQANFVRLMNTRAKDLGMSKTHFENASGLPNSDQVTTARDMITLGMRLQDDFPGYYPMFAMRVFNYHGASHRNHNTMLNNFAGIDGIKTGYTSKSGFNLVSSVHRGGKHIVGAVFGGSSAASRNGEMRMLLTRALMRASTVKTRKPAASLVAKLKLKAEPKLAQRPAKPKPPVEVALKPQPQRQDDIRRIADKTPASEVELPAVTAGPRAPVTVEPAATPDPVVPVTAALPPAPVEVFKVKKVSVTQPAAPVSAEETTDMGPDEEAAADPIAAKVAEPTRLALADTSAEPTIDTLVAAHEAAISQETVIAKTSAPGPAANFDRSQMAMLGAPDTAAAAPSAPVTAPAPLAAPSAAPAPAVAPISKSSDLKSVAPRPATAGTIEPQRKAVLKTSAAPAPQPVQRGLPPSTLQAQAASIAPARPARDVILAATASAGGYEIQIGAYDSVEEAQRNLVAVQGKAGRVLSGHPSVTEPASKAGKQIYRARFRGFSADSASTACSTLRGQSINCFVMAAD